MRRALFLLGLAGCHVFFGIDDVPIPDAAPPTDGAPQPGRWAEVAVGIVHTCAIDTDHGLWCWGSNLDGALGTSTQANHAVTPQKVTSQPDRWVAVTAGDHFSCALDLDGAIWCWGHNGEGELALDNRVDQPTPTKIAGTYDLIAGSTYHTCARDAATHALVCWGYNPSGQVGTGTLMNALTPTVIDPLPYALIAPGQSFSCGMREDNTTVCWGQNNVGQFGDGGAEPLSLTPIVVGTETPWRSLSAGYDSACGVTTAGKLRCWGSNSYGVVGDGTGLARNAPVPVLDADGNDAADWTDVDVGTYQACARRSDGTVWCWGGGFYGQLAAPTANGIDAPSMQATTGGTWTAVVAGASSTCAIDATHALYCAGIDGLGQLGDGGSSPSVPTKIAAAPVAAQVFAGGNTTCITDAARTTLSCTGQNGYGQVGDGTVYDRMTFASIAVPGGSGGFASIAVGHTHTCAATTAKGVACWGSNGRGELGIGAVSGGMLFPTTLAGFLAGGLAASESTCALGADTYLYCWGPDDFEQLGVNTAAQQAAPTSTGISGTMQVVDGYYHACALGVASTVACWGRGSEGELGDGTMPATSLPVTVTDLVATSLAAGAFSNYAIDAANHAWVWGSNASGQLGLGDIANRASATQLPGTWKQFAAGDAHACALDMQGAAWCWGSNARGQLGDGSLVERDTPQAIAPGKTWTMLAAGASHTCAIDASDSALWCWGSDDNGQLGDGDAWRARWIQIP